MTSWKRPWWWLSFADPTQPSGRQFLGAVLVRAASLEEATREAWRLKINPGGEIMAFEVPSQYECRVSDDVAYRLLSREEIEVFERRWAN